jgi:hypothetical protein
MATQCRNIWCCSFAHVLYRHGTESRSWDRLASHVSEVSVSCERLHIANAEIEEDWTRLAVSGPVSRPLSDRRVGIVPMNWRRSRGRALSCGTVSRERGHHVACSANEDRSPRRHQQQGTTVCSDCGNSPSPNAEISFSSHKYCVPFCYWMSKKWPVWYLAVVGCPGHGAVTVGMLSVWLLVSDQKKNANFWLWMWAFIPCEGSVISSKGPVAQGHSIWTHVTCSWYKFNLSCRLKNL